MHPLLEALFSAWDWRVDVSTLLLTFGALYGPVTRNGRQGTNPLGLLFLIILAPISASLIQLAISRTREYAADQGSAAITGNPLSLVSALKKLQNAAQQMPLNGNPAFSPLLIINPLSKEGLQTLFMTHPPVEERIRRLAELAAQGKNQATTAAA